MPSSGGAQPALPRSSNLSVKKAFTDADKDRHLDEAFEFMARFFEGSLQELEQRNAGLQATFRRIDADSFTGTIYSDGKNVAECKIARGGYIDGGITYSSNPRRQGNGINESMSVETDGQGMHPRAPGVRGATTSAGIRALPSHMRRSASTWHQDNEISSAGHCIVRYVASP